ncbi:hypothetical protein VP01_2999g1 [Puccinia sorghi]|uniref:Uncharacterized protein n=1 Tax=Puccinia sorghi TaxID=27349 RepID=A0A0L6V260_9BASI|nr:hypothetical protein VP01_2999g1 [Puccinia sorghi]
MLKPLAARPTTSAFRAVLKWLPFISHHHKPTKMTHLTVSSKKKKIQMVQSTNGSLNWAARSSTLNLKIYFRPLYKGAEAGDNPKKSDTSFAHPTLLEIISEFQMTVKDHKQNDLCSPFYYLYIHFLCNDHIENVDKSLSSEPPSISQSKSIRNLKTKLKKQIQLSQTIKVWYSAAWLSTNLKLQFMILMHLEGQPNIFSFSSLEDEPLPLPLSPKPVFKHAKATRKPLCLQLASCHHEVQQYVTVTRQTYSPQHNGQGYQLNLGPSSEKNRLNVCTTYNQHTTGISSLYDQFKRKNLRPQPVIRPSIIPVYVKQHFKIFREYPLQVFNCQAAIQTPPFCMCRCFGTVTVHQSLVESLREKGGSNTRSFVGLSAFQLQANFGLEALYHFQMGQHFSFPSSTITKPFVKGPVMNDFGNKEDFKNESHISIQKGLLLFEKNFTTAELRSHSSKPLDQILPQFYQGICWVSNINFKIPLDFHSYFCSIFQLFEFIQMNPRTGDIGNGIFLTIPNFVGGGYILLTEGCTKVQRLDIIPQLWTPLEKQWSREVTLYMYDIDGFLWGGGEQKEIGRGNFCCEVGGKKRFNLSHKKLLKKSQQSFWCYSQISPRVIQPRFDTQSLCRLHSGCAKTSNYAKSVIDYHPYVLHHFFPFLFPSFFFTHSIITSLTNHHSQQSNFFKLLTFYCPLL